MPEVVGTEERIAHIAYDSGTPGVSDTELNLFAEQIGGGGTPKTWYDTNMDKPGQFAGNDMFVINAFRLGFEPDITVAEMVAMLKGYIEFEIANKPYLKIPLFFLAAGSGLHINASASSTGTVQYGQLGEPEQSSLYALGEPITLNQQQSFSCKITWPAAPAGSAAKIYVGLDGELVRSVQ